MIRVRVPVGSKVNLETLIDNLQSFSFTNYVTNRFNKMIGNSGTFISLALPDSLKATLISQSQFTIAAGWGITDAGDYINIASPVTVTFSGISNDKGYCVKLVYKEAGTDPVTVLNGFMYDSVGTNNIVQYSKYSDSYSVITEEITDGMDYSDMMLARTDKDIYLATFATTGATKGAFEDLRPEQQLKFEPAFLDPDDVVKKTSGYVTDELKINADLKLSDATRTFTARVTTSGLNITSSSGNTNLNLRKADGTLAGYFDFANKAMYIDGKRVKTEATTATSITSVATKPLNLRLDSVFSNRSDYLTNVATSSNLSYTHRLGGMSNHINAFIKWGWDSLTAGVASNKITISATQMPEISTIDQNSMDSLIGHYVYVENLTAGNSNLKITAVTYTNPNFVFTVTYADGSTFSNVNTTGKTARIHPNGDEYYIVAVPRNSVDSAYDVDSRVEARVVFRESPTAPVSTDVTMQLLPQVAYRFIAATRFSDSYSEFTDFTSSSLISHAQVTNSGVTLSAGQTDRGFSVTALGPSWTDVAEAYEVEYWKYGQSSNKSYIVSQNLPVDVPVVVDGAYEGTIRPLICGQGVATAMSFGKVNAGSIEMLANYSVIADFKLGAAIGNYMEGYVSLTAAASQATTGFWDIFSYTGIQWGSITLSGCVNQFNVQLSGITNGLQSIGFEGTPLQTIYLSGVGELDVYTSFKLGSAGGLGNVINGQYYGTFSNGGVYNPSFSIAMTPFTWGSQARNAFEIGKITLPIDYKLSKILFFPDYYANESSTNNVYIRVIQNGIDPGESNYLETGNAAIRKGTMLVQDTNMILDGNQELTVEFYIEDANGDPVTTSTVTAAGRVVLMGYPYFRTK